jgi:hypothetical protein
VSGVRPADLPSSGALFQGHIRWALDQAALRRQAHDKEMGLAASLAVCAMCGSRRWSSRAA